MDIWLSAMQAEKQLKQIVIIFENLIYSAEWGIQLIISYVKWFLSQTHSSL